MRSHSVTFRINFISIFSKIFSSYIIRVAVEPKVVSSNFIWSPISDISSLYIAIMKKGRKKLMSGHLITLSISTGRRFIRNRNPEYLNKSIDNILGGEFNSIYSS